MKNVLFMHTGSGNHGCEAIVKTTSSLLNGPNDIILWSFTKSEDEYYGVNRKVESIVESEQIEKYSFSYFEALIKRKLLKQNEANLNVFIKKLFKNNVAISIGGDNYCYEWSAKQAIQLDKEIRKYCSKSVLWGCSINPEAITSEMKEDIEKFDLITARESITYQLLKEINPNTFQVADPAFILNKIEKKLPQNFIEKNTIGINVSPLVMNYEQENNSVIKNYRKLIEFILEKTNMNICFIPHVIWEYNNDLKPLKKLYDIYKDTNRVSLIEDGTCEELKGYISRCRFFVGARTHATIAAYSTCVPTLVLGYSVKSKGIATDLFGTYENYVIPVQTLEDENELVKSFSWMLNHEEEIKERLNTIIPDYIEKARYAKSVFDNMLKK